MSGDQEIPEEELMGMAPVRQKYITLTNPSDSVLRNAMADSKHVPIVLVRGDQNPMLLVHSEMVRCWLRDIADEAGLSDRNMSIVQLSFPYEGESLADLKKNADGEFNIWKIPSFVAMLSNIHDSRESTDCADPVTGQSPVGSAPTTVSDTVFSEMVDDKILAVAEEAAYGRHERGFINTPLIDAIDMRKVLAAVFSHMVSRDVVGMFDESIDPIYDEMQRRMALKKTIDHETAETDPDWLPMDDTQIGVEFALEFMARDSTLAAIRRRRKHVEETPAVERAAAIVRSYAHHSLWGSLLNYKWSSDTEAAIRLVTRSIERAILEDRPVSDVVEEAQMLSDPSYGMPGMPMPFDISVIEHILEETFQFVSTTTAGQDNIQAVIEILNEQPLFQKSEVDSINRENLGLLKDYRKHVKERETLNAQVRDITSTLEKIACRHVTEQPLWWQVDARAAIDRYKTGSPNVGTVPKAMASAVNGRHGPDGRLTDDRVKELREFAARLDWCIAADDREDWDAAFAELLARRASVPDDATINDLLDIIDNHLADASVSFPAGRDAGYAIDYDVSKMSAALSAFMEAHHIAGTGKKVDVSTVKP